MFNSPQHKILLADSEQSILHTGDNSCCGHAGLTFTLTAISDNHTNTDQEQLTSVWITTSARTLLMIGDPSLTPTKLETPQMDDPTGVQLVSTTPHPTVPVNTTDNNMKQLIITSLWKPLSTRSNRALSYWSKLVGVLLLTLAANPGLMLTANQSGRRGTILPATTCLHHLIFFLEKSKNYKVTENWRLCA